MTTQAQIDANRRNASHSTGPRTPAGKEQSSRNATTFGFYSRHLLLPGEDIQLLHDYRRGVYARLKPADEVERTYVERFIMSAWRLKRALAGEETIFAHWRKWHSDSIKQPADLHATQNAARELDCVQKHIAALERSMDRALKELNQLQKLRKESDEPVEAASVETASNESPDESPEVRPAAIDEIEPNSSTDDPSPLRDSGSARIEIVKSNPIRASESQNNEIEPNSAAGFTPRDGENSIPDPAKGKART